MTSKLRDPYAQAALAYLAYGCIYLCGSVAEMRPEFRQTFFGFVPWWAFFVVGSLFVVGVPPLIWRRWGRLRLPLWRDPTGARRVLPIWRALTGFWGLLPAGKAWVLLRDQVAILRGGGSPPAWKWLFVAVAAAASVLLLRAALSDEPRAPAVGA